MPKERKTSLRILLLCQQLLRRQGTNGSAFRNDPQTPKIYTNLPKINSLGADHLVSVFFSYGYSELKLLPGLNVLVCLASGHCLNTATLYTVKGISHRRAFVITHGCSTVEKAVIPQVIHLAVPFYTSYQLMLLHADLYFLIRQLPALCK